ncbi:MAG: hypothetical protein PHO41_02610 [Eubacteriales bacterium]|nr:hypothetical protein [Eubacteriales bacterium]
MLTRTALLVLGGIVALAVLLVALPLRIRLIMDMDSLQEVVFRFQLRFAYVLPVQFCLRFHIIKKPSFTLYLLRRKKERRVWDMYTQRKHEPESWVSAFVRSGLRSLHAKKIDIHGEVGVQNDAALTAILTGMLQTALTVPLMYILNPQQRSVLLINVRPYFSGDRFRLNLEGIARHIPAKSIWQATVSKIKSRRNQKACPTQSKTF